jgi:dimethylaniline monooxygenase (N-oxide forming)
VTLPPATEMREQIKAYDAALRKRYVASKRHTIQVDAAAYRHELDHERRTRRRAT